MAVLNFQAIFVALFLLCSLGATAAAGDPPKISVSEMEFDLGRVNEGVELHHTFKIKNVGGGKLIIRTAFSTCGCTIPTIKRKEIPPDEEGDLDVLIDTSMKQGDVAKPIEIHTNDPVTPITTLYIKAKVTSPHADLSDAKAKIFTGRCAACHVTKGIGKHGEELFQADCAMCHGFRAMGIPGVAPALVPKNYEDPTTCEVAKQIISHGSPSHRSMAGYLDSAGGPLTEKDIDSLVKFLRKRTADVVKEDPKLREKPPAEPTLEQNH